MENEIRKITQIINRKKNKLRTMLYRNDTPNHTQTSTQPSLFITQSTDQFIHFSNQIVQN